MTMFVLGLPGLFSRYYHNQSPWIRYFSDSAYWVFILHSIPLVVIALLMHSWIGELLNGRLYQNSPLDSGREI